MSMRGKRVFKLAGPMDVLGVKPSEANRKRAEKFSEKSGWLGVEGGYAAVESLVRHGWPEGLKRIEESLKVLAPQGVASIRRRRVRREFGDFVDMQRVYAGDLNQAWESTERRVQTGLGRVVVTILVDVMLNATTRASEMFWRGATAVALARALEASGRRVQIVGFSVSDKMYHGEKSGDLTVEIIRLKEADQPLDLERLATTTALAGFARGCLFRLEMTDERTANNGLGHAVYYRPGRVTEATLKRLPPSLRELAGEAGTIIVDGIWDQYDAQKFLDGQLEQFNEAEAKTAGRTA